MDTRTGMIIPLNQCADASPAKVGGKAHMLGRLMREGFSVPPGICLTVDAYAQFLYRHDLGRVLELELERKGPANLRWEEMWDAALRLRSRFLKASLPTELQAAIRTGLQAEAVSAPWVVRSSAPAEDARGSSFAGLHESVVGVRNHDELWDALRTVWASLWSDAAILYRRELGLDSQRSRMAVVIQSLVERSPSGVAFGRDPRHPENNCSVVEAVPGLCRDLVDGEVDPDRWVIDNTSGSVVEERRGERGESDDTVFMPPGSLTHLWRVVRSLEEIFAFYPDTEWTGREDDLVLLQARPMTTAPDGEKAAYLELRPGPRRLRELARRVAEELIPRLAAEGVDWTRENLEGLTDAQLADSLRERMERLEYWKAVYKKDFIPFAHGVRALGRYYNDLMRPEDPYEFLGLLRGSDMLASRRNRAMANLAVWLADRKDLQRELAAWISSGEDSIPLHTALKDVPGVEDFGRKLGSLLVTHFDVVYGDTRLGNQSVSVVSVILEMAQTGRTLADTDASRETQLLEARFFKAAGAQKREEAREVLRIGRLSWRLRDDDNILVGRLESQLRRALDLAAARLRRQGRIPPDKEIPLTAVPRLTAALKSPGGETVTWPETAPPVTETSTVGRRYKPRQLTGQPASPGMATGPARVIAAPRDLAGFHAGEVLVCDAIQPNMTHLVPLAAAVVERRGGMLIHGAIIAREMGIPCVNGVPAAAQVIHNGDVVSVDGHLGIVTLGVPELDLENAAP